MCRRNRTMFASVGLFFVVLSFGVEALPQGGYGGGQYYTATTSAAQQPQYISAPQTFYETSPQQQVSQQYAQPQPPTARVSQVLLPSSADRQVQKAAEQIAGPQYAQQVRLAHQEGLAQRALDAARARAQHQLRRAQQQAQQPQQYVEAVASQQYVQQPQQQYQIQYQPEYQQQKPLRAAPQQQRPRPSPLEKQQEEEHDNDASYQFGFDVKDDLYTNYQNRKEQREGGKISGSYSVVDSDGFIRTVTYTADPKEGFKAEVVRQPTDIVVKIPKPRPQPEDGHQYIQEVPVQRYQAEPQHHQHQQRQQQKANVVYQYQ